MKYLLHLFAVVTMISASSDFEKWKDFKVKFNKKYSTPEEESKRYSVFQENLCLIEHHNKQFQKGETTYKMGITRFADISQEEFFDKANNKIPPSGKYNLDTVDRPVGYCSKYEPRLNTSLFDVNPPDAIDFRNLDVVLPPRDMGDRTADVAFSIAASLEISLALYTYNNVYLSPQFLIDCAENNASVSYQRAFHNGMPLDFGYPLIEGKGDCRDVCGVCYGYMVLANETDIKTLIAVLSPVTIWFDGGDLNLYESGIIDGSNCNYDESDPSKWRKPWNALIIGYGTEDGTDYWIVKNSLGTSWGEDGYFRLIRDKSACGIETYPVSSHLENPIRRCSANSEVVL